MAYAERTKVPVGQSKADIEKLIKKYGASAFGIMESSGIAQIAFAMNDRNILFRVRIPEQAQEERSMWRALLLTIKGKLESAERGIETFEDAFLANIVMPDGRTVSDHTVPAIESHYSGDARVPLLPQLN
ncbi:hypothetical protein [Roseibium album]|uniref:hypothetical protein n=1 Tax=Roseibium album TaxID=311410 RepID=UPI00391A78D3